METTVDWEGSRRFAERIATYFNGGVLNAMPELVCSEASKCRRSAETRGYGFAGGQLSYVGDAYACHVGGRSFRVLVVSMQVGDREAPVTMARRSQQIAVRIPERPGQRNPHMRGVTRALQLLHGLTLDSADEELPDGTHVLRAYAMANSTLCSALPTGGKSRRGSPTSVMLDSCSRHLEATLSNLEPTVIQVQGVDTLAAIDRISTMHERLSTEVAVINVAGRRVVRCATSHPAAGPPVSWSSIRPGSYFAEVVAPALELTRHLALELTS